MDFSNPYKLLARETYAATLGIVYDTDGAKLVNSWVAEKTDGLVNFVLDDVRGYISFLVNSTYLKGQWAEPFDAKETKQRPFTDRNQKMQRTDFMMHTGTYDYYGDPYIRVLAKPYYDRRFKMYIVQTGDGRVPVEEDFKKAYNNMKSAYVHLEIPKMDIATSFNMKEHLNKLGISDAFTQITGRFSTMYLGVPKDRIPYISLVMQEARFRIDEKGTEAVATAFETQNPAPVSSEKTPIQFVCNSPFSYFVINDETGDIIYAGEFAYLE